MRKVYIDCGSNKAKITRKFLADGNLDYEYFMFEPLPKFKDLGSKLQSEYPDVKIQYFEKAVWIEDTELNFYLCGRGDEGSSLCENKFSNRMDKEHPITVEAVDFSSWLKNNFTADDYIICKIDIEGAEYDVIPKMINDGSIELINEIMVEFHGRKQLIATQAQHDAYKMINEYFEKSSIKFTRWW